MGPYGKALSSRKAIPTERRIDLPLIAPLPRQRSPAAHDGPTTSGATPWPRGAISRDSRPDRAGERDQCPAASSPPRPGDPPSCARRQTPPLPSAGGPAPAP